METIYKEEPTTTLSITKEEKLLLYDLISKEKKTRQRKWDNEEDIKIKQIHHTRYIQALQLLEKVVYSL